MTLEIVLKMILYILITGCLPIIVKYLVSATSAKIDEIQTTTKLSAYTQLNKYIDIAQSAIKTAVSSVSQTYVDTLKELGTFDATAQETAKTNAISIAKSLIIKDVKNAITILYGDFETYLDNSIEEMVKTLK